MLCPRCHYDVDYVRCPACFATVNARDVERMAQLAYLRNRLEEWARRGLFTRATTDAALAETDQELSALHARLGLNAPAPPATAPASPLAAPAPSLSAAGAGPVPVSGPVVPAPAARAAGTPAQPPGWTEPPAPRPPLTWQRVGSALLSERTLNTLLVVGALLILASASVISTLNPTHLPPLVHFGALVATTLAFFLASYALRARFGLHRTASALLVISAVFLPLDVWTLGQDRLLRWTPNDVWLAASGLCLPTYLLIHALLRDRIVAVLTAGAGASLALALAQRAGLALEWWGCALVLLALLYAVLAPRLRPALPLLAWALLSCGQLLTVLSLALLTVPSSAALLGLTLNASTGDTLAATWWLATLFYVAYRRCGGHAYYAAVAASLSAVAALITVLRFPILGPWTGVAVAALACVYGGIGFVRYRRAAPLPPARLLLLWPYHLAVVLSVAALLWPASLTPGGAAADGALVALSRAVAEALLVALYAYGARRAHGPICAAVAVWLLPLILANLTLTLPLPDPLITWSLFAAAAVALAEVAARRGTNPQQNPSPVQSPAPRPGPAPQRDPTAQQGPGPWPFRVPRWRSPFALPLFALGYGAGAAVLGLGLARDAATFAATGRPAQTAAVILALGLLALVALASGLLRRAPPFLHLAAWIAIAPYLSLATLYEERLRWANVRAGEGGAVMALALSYLLLAALLDGRLRTGARVLYPPAYALSAAVAVYVSPDRGAFAWLFGLTLATYAGSAWLVATGRHGVFLEWVAAVVAPEMRRGARALFSYLCAWLFPLWLLVALSVWIPDLSAGQYGLALALLAPIYLAGAVALTRVAPEQGTPWTSAGVLLSIVGPLLTVNDPWPRLIAATLALATFTGAALYSRRPAWAYGIALDLPFLAFALLDRLPVGYDYYALSFLPVAGGCLVAGRVLRARAARPGWSRPFFRVAYGGLGLLLLSLAVSAFFAHGQTLAVSLWTALAYSLTLAAFAWRERERPCAWLAVGFTLVAVQAALNAGQVPATSQPVCWALIGFALSLLFALVRPRRRPRQGQPLWSRPLEWTAGGLALFSPLGALAQMGALPGHTGEQAFALTLAVVGLQFVTWGLDQRERLLVYAGVAGVLCAYLVQLSLYRVTQPQLFVVPVGAYLLGVSYVEWRVAPRRPTKSVLEISGLAITLGTSLLQALGVLADRTPSSVYDLIILGEGVILMALGASLRWKRTLTAAAGALSIDAVLIAARPLRALNTWYVTAIVGLAIIAAVVVIEKKRQGIVTLLGHWRQLQETWE